MENSENDKKENIKNAAKELFLHFGFGKTSMDDIARQSALSKPTLYHYYSNKEAIFNDVVIDEARRFMDRVEKKLPTNIPADQKIADFLLMIYNGLKIYYKEISELPVLMYHQYPHGQPIVEKINEMFKEKLYPLLRDGINDGIFQIEDDVSALSALTYMTDFLNLDWMRRIPEESRDCIVENVIHIILNGIRRR